ncbi:MAG TPA: ABC transporter permease [Vicinamibacterales bacterium]|nr:ABC transporter permease [Vicinamibacterales bacterium]
MNQVCRRLIREPKVPLLAIATLALAIGGGGALLSVSDALLMRTLAVPHAEQLVAAYPALGEALLGMPMRTLVSLRERQQLITDLCGYARGALDVEVRGVTATYRNEAFTGGCYAMLGVQPRLGRLIDQRDAPDAGEPAAVAVVSTAFWKNALGGDPAVIGQTLRANGAQLTIIGVTPSSFSGLDVDQAPDVTVPLGLMSKLLGRRDAVALYTVGRLRPGVSVEEARSHVRALWPDVWSSTNPAKTGVPASSASAVTSLRVEPVARGLSVQRDQYSRALLFLLLLAAILTVLAVLNVGGLFLAQASAREPEFAMRTALGGTLWRMGLPLLGEGLVIGVAAALAAIPIAWWTGRALAATMWTRSTPTTMDVAPSVNVLAALGALGVMTGLLVSIPALVVVGRRSRLIGGAGTYTIVSGATRWWRRLLIVGQIAVSVVLVFCASLFARELGTINSLAPGYQPEGLRWARLALAFGQPQTIDQAAYFRPVLDRLVALPGVTGAALSLGFPTTERRHVTALAPFRRADAPNGAEVSGTVEYVSPAFFSTVGVRMEGREFEWSDREGQEPVAIINRLLASRLFPAGDAIGERLQLTTASSVASVAVVGVVENFSPGDVRIHDLPMVYLPLLQNPRLMSAPTLVLRVSDARALAESVRHAVQPLGRHRVDRVQTIADQWRRFHMRERVLTGLAAAFAGLSVLVGGVGLFGLLVQFMTTRVREIAIRLALGAQRRIVVSAVVREGLLLVVSGVAIGVPVSLVAERSARALVSELASRDSVSLGVSVLLMLCIALVACWWPALRASRVEPAAALRQP